jgi:hypothetical protein
MTYYYDDYRHGGYSQASPYVGACKNVQGRPVEATLMKLESSNRIPSKDKFRMMPCKTFIMTGACPYHERCKHQSAAAPLKALNHPLFDSHCAGAFLHDPRVRSDVFRPKPLRALRHENTSSKDAFYWPDMKVL